MSVAWQSDPKCCYKSRGMEISFNIIVFSVFENISRAGFCGVAAWVCFGSRGRVVNILQTSVGEFEVLLEHISNVCLDS